MPIVEPASISEWAEHGLLAEPARRGKWEALQFMTKWNTNQFLRHVGREPVNDDLDRCNCDKAGEQGHKACGICEHYRPVFECQTCFPKCMGNIKRI